MSYRFRFIKANKENLMLRDMTINELKTHFINLNNKIYRVDDLEGECFNVIEMFNQKELYDFATLPFVIKLLENTPLFFTNAETNEYFKEYNIHLCDEKTFLLAIDCMRELIAENYRELLTKSHEEIKAEIQSKIEEWQPLSQTLGLNKDLANYQSFDEAHFPYNTDKTKDAIVSSWLYEYSIFELVKIYREFDWENDCLLIYGW